MFILTDRFGNVDYVCHSVESMQKHMMDTYRYYLDDLELGVIETNFEKLYLTEIDFETDKNMVYVLSGVDGPTIKVFESRNDVAVYSFKLGMDENGRYIFDNANVTLLDSVVEMDIKLTYTKVHAN